jgi:hypothetical protein
MGIRPTKLPHLSVSVGYEINELCKLSATARRIWKTVDTSSKCVGMVGEYLKFFASIEATISKLC